MRAPTRRRVGQPRANGQHARMCATKGPLNPNDATNFKAEGRIP